MSRHSCDKRLILTILLCLFVHSMANLLHKLRIDYSTLTMLQGMQDQPKQSTIDFHMQLLEGFREGQNDDCFVPDTELETLEKKTHRQLRLRELLLEHSKDASLVVMSLPMPRKVNFMATKKTSENFNLWTFFSFRYRTLYPHRCICHGWNYLPTTCHHSCWFEGINVPY